MPAELQCAHLEGVLLLPLTGVNSVQLLTTQTSTALESRGAPALGADPTNLGPDACGTLWTNFGVPFSRQRIQLGTRCDSSDSCRV